MDNQELMPFGQAYEERPSDFSPVDVYEEYDKYDKKVLEFVALVPVVAEKREIVDHFQKREGESYENSPILINFSINLPQISRWVHSDEPEANPNYQKEILNQKNNIVVHLPHRVKKCEEKNRAECYVP